MAVTLQIAKPEALQRTKVTEPDNAGRQLCSWPWMQWFLNVYRLLSYLKVGSGTPENAVTASPPTLYLNISGGAGTTLYVKESGVDTNTGWIGK